MSGKFEIIDHTADIGIAAYGSDLKEAFASAACGLFSLMVEMESIEESTSRKVEVAADNRRDLLVAWLNELIYIHDTEGMLFGRFVVNELNDKNLKAECYGEGFDIERHEMRTEVKAATYHNVRIEETSGGCKVQVLFDI
jgi:SHS2 domain-containing protein